MPDIFIKIILICLSYFIGSISPSYLIAKYIYKFDIRTRGSGNCGTTNAIRTMGWKIGILTFVIDMLKGSLASYIGVLYAGEDFGIITGISAIIGHTYPFYLGFKGGKGVATTMGIGLTVVPELLLILGSIGLILAFATKMVSVGSISAFSILFFISIIHLYKEGFQLLYAVLAVLSVVIVYKHRGNIKRIINGTENKLGEKNESSGIRRR
jgi:glycerol-3-phosphate acyltransferase PlsY